MGHRAGWCALGILIAACSGSGGGDAGTPTGVPTGASQVRINAGDAQTGFAGMAVGIPPSIRVTDSRGTPAAGVAVTFVPRTGSGTVSGAAQTTGTDGIATIGGWTLGDAVGANALVARATGVADSVVIAAVAVPRVLTVQAVVDVVNGNTSSPATLVAAPGPDGISLREAITAVNAAPAPFEIRFAPELLGQSISIASGMPSIARAGTAIVGVRGADTSARVTIDGSANTAGPILSILTSNVSVTGIRFANIAAGHAIRVGGLSFQQIADVRIEDNIFDNRALTVRAYAVAISGLDPPAASTRITRVTVNRNTFLHFQGDDNATLIESRGDLSAIDNVTISNNVYTDCSFPVELVHPTGTTSVIRNVRITANTFSGSLSFAINFGNSAPLPARANLIDSTVITGNTFIGGRTWALFALAGYSGASGNLISNTWFVGNVVAQGSGVAISAATDASTGNRVAATMVAGNRFTGLTGPALSASRGPTGTIADSVLNTWFVNNVLDHSAGLFAGPGLDGFRVINNTFNATSGLSVAASTSGGGVHGLEIKNSIFWATSGDFIGVLPENVSFSVTLQPGFAGANGNLVSDPLFVDAAGGDFRLQPTSPAIDHGTAACAPANDFLCRTRTSVPDIGAFEYGTGTPVCSGTIPALLPGCPGILRLIQPPKAPAVTDSMSAPCHAR